MKPERCVSGLVFTKNGPVLMERKSQITAEI